MRIKSKEKKKELTQMREKQILGIAAEVFSLKGFANAQVDEIADLAGLGKGTIYRYFKDKKGLFLSIVDRGLDKLKNTILMEVEKTDDPLKKIENAIRTYLSFFEENKDLIGILIHEQSSFQNRITKRYFEHYYGNIDRIRQTFKIGIEKGLIKDIDIEGAISVLISTLNGLIYMWQIEGKKYRLSDKVPIVLKIFFSGIVKNEKKGAKYERAK